MAGDALQDAPQRLRADRFVQRDHLVILATFLCRDTHVRAAPTHPLVTQSARRRHERGAADVARDPQAPSGPRRARDEPGWTQLAEHVHRLWAAPRAQAPRWLHPLLGLLPRTINGVRGTRSFPLPTEAVKGTPPAPPARRLHRWSRSAGRGHVSDGVPGDGYSSACCRAPAWERCRRYRHRHAGRGRYGFQWWRRSRRRPVYSSGPGVYLPGGGELNWRAVIRALGSQRLNGGSRCELEIEMVVELRSRFQKAIIYLSDIAPDDLNPV